MINVGFTAAADALVPELSRFAAHLVLRCRQEFPAAFDAAAASADVGDDAAAMCKRAAECSHDLLCAYAEHLG